MLDHRYKALFVKLGVWFTPDVTAVQTVQVFTHQSIKHSPKKFEGHSGVSWQNTDKP